jgi:hypothetical protein
VAEVCKKTARIPSIGYAEPVRVCDVCFDQVELVRVRLRLRLRVRVSLSLSLARTLTLPLTR